MHRYFAQPLNIKRSLQVLEVGLRDGLQNESKILSVDQKLNYFRFMFYAGLRNIEIGSFVSPKWVPQMSGTKELITQVESYRRTTVNPTYPNVTSSLYLSALVPNLKGCMDAIDAKVNEICLFVSTTDTFNLKNINCTQREAFQRFKDVVDLAKKHKIKVRGSLSCCFVCPYEGLVNPQKVVDSCMMYKDLGVDMIDIADTIGAATVAQVDNVFDQVLQKVGTVDLFSAHFHDTNGQALELIDVASKKGITLFHSSLGGTGGCPYSSKRVGNLNTIKLVEWCKQNNIETNLNLNLLKQGQAYIANQLKY